MQPNAPTPEAVPVEAIAGPVAVLIVTILTWAAFVIWLQTATGGRLP